MRIADYLYETKVISTLFLKSIREGRKPGENQYGWCKSTISNLLSNEVCLGKIIYGKTRKVILSARRNALVKKFNLEKCYADDTEKFFDVLRECFIIDKLEKETLNKLVQKITVG